MIDLADDHYPIDISHARDELGWEPKHRLRDTLPEIVDRLKRDPKKWYEINSLPVPEEAEPKDVRQAEQLFIDHMFNQK
jgi:dTDP-D-glucose 4,6-dehydratase